MDILGKKLSFKKINRKKWNKIVLGFFLFIVISTLLMKIVDGILLDLGYGIDGEKTLHLYYWQEKEYINRMSLDDHLYDMIRKHPHTFWFLTQFTWITTIIIIFLLVFRFFRYDGKIPKWLRWTVMHRTLSLITIYDTIIGAIFWISIFEGFSKNFHPLLNELEMTYTVFVHTVIPILMIIYSLFFLINDNKASALRDMTIWRGMIYPIIYMAFYSLIAVIWNDPYPITNLNESFIENIWKLPVALLGFLFLISLMIIMHNFILLKFNKKYNPKKDHDDEMLKISQHNQNLS